MKTTSARQIFPALLLGCFFALVQPAHALDMEYYTYNGFGPVSQAFTKIALIFSDAGYVTLFAAIIILGLIAAFFAFAVKSATGAKLMPLSWIYPVFAGVAIYLALFVPKGNITVYDPVLNRFQTIAGIPNGVVFTAGVLNKIERGLVDIIDTAGVPGSKYQEAAGGIGFTALKEAMNATVKNNFLQQSLAQYVEDCVMFEMARPGTSFSVDAMSYTSNNFLTEFAEAASPAIYTVYYDDANKGGVTMTCQASWTALDGILKVPATYQDSLKAVCGATLFNPNSALELQQCKDLISNTLFNNTGIAAQPEDLARQGFMTQIIYQVISKANPNVVMALQGNRQIVTSGMGMASSLNEWLPIMRAIMTAIAIGLIPFLVLFVPTPLFGKGLGAMAGFFVFLTTWGIADAIVHGAALDYATTAMEDIKQSGLGLATCLNFPENSTKIMGMFGMIRGSSIMLASFLSTMLIRFGGHALAMISGNLQSAVAGGGQAAARALTPEGRAQAREQMVNAASADGWMNSNSFGTMAQAGMNARNLSTQANTAGFEAKYAGAQQQGFKGSRQEFMAAMSSEGSFINSAGERVSVRGNTGAFETTSTANKMGFTSSASGGQDGTILRQHNQGKAISMTTVQHAGGQEELQQVDLSNLKGKVAEQYQNTMISKAAHGLSSNDSYSLLKSYSAQHSNTNAQAQQFLQSLQNSEQQAMTRSIENGTMLQNVKSEELNKTLHGGASLDLNFGVARVGGGYQANVVSKDGKSTTISLSEKDAQSLQHNVQAVRQEALTQTLQNQDSRTWAEQATRNKTMNESNSYLQEAQKRDTNSVALESNILMPIIRDIAIKEHGGDFQAAAADLNYQAGVAPEQAMARINKSALLHMPENGVDGMIASHLTGIHNDKQEMTANPNIQQAEAAGGVVASGSMTMPGHTPLNQIDQSQNNTMTDTKGTLHGIHETASGRDPLAQVASKLSYHPDENTVDYASSNFREKVSNTFPDSQQIDHFGAQAFAPSGYENSTSALDPLAFSSQKSSSKPTSIELNMGGGATEGDTSTSSPTPGGGGHSGGSAIPK
ncbi:MAG: hypothetical protein ACD_74C00151G0005 [uncultured bacterium]|nr:MAG: hypothetical protein ACD_74C00151G0005 [uncultured bacterium]